jgi:hypothetical protein
MSVNDRQSGFSMANRAPRGNLLIDARCDNRGSAIHQRFHLGVCRGQQELLNCHDAEKCVGLTHDNVARALITLPNQVLSDIADPLEGAGHRDARGGMFGSRFEGHVGLALRWLAGLYSVHQPIPSCNRLTHASRSLSALQVTLTPAEIARIEDAIPVSAVAGSRYDEHQMRIHDSER